MKNTSVNDNKTFQRAGMDLGLAVAVMFPHAEARAGQSPVNLGTAGNYVILAKSGISTVPPSAVTGNLRRESHRRNRHHWLFINT